MPYIPCNYCATEPIYGCPWATATATATTISLSGGFDFRDEVLDFGVQLFGLA